MPPAIEAILSDPESCVDGFLAAGHVCAITGNGAYRHLAEKYKTPIVVTGFEPADLLLGIYCCLLQLEAGIYKVENVYKRVVPEEGNPPARALMEETLELCDPPGVARPRNYSAKRITAKRDICTARCLAPSPPRLTRRHINSVWRLPRRVWKRDSALLVILCEERNKRKTVPFSERSAHPTIRSVRRWFLRKGFARLIIDINRFRI